MASVKAGLSSVIKPGKAAETFLFAITYTGLSAREPINISSSSFNMFIFEPYNRATFFNDRVRSATSGERSENPQLIKVGAHHSSSSQQREGGDGLKLI